MNGNEVDTIKFANQLANTAIDEALPLALESNNSTVIILLEPKLIMISY